MIERWADMAGEVIISNEHKNDLSPERQEFFVPDYLNRSITHEVVFGKIFPIASINLWNYQKLQLRLKASRLETDARRAKSNDYFSKSRRLKGEAETIRRNEQRLEPNQDVYLWEERGINLLNEFLDVI